MHMLTIGRLASKAGVRIDTIRFYERVGLFAAGEKSGSGYRLYADSLVRTVRFIKCAQRCGFSLAEIAELMRRDSSRGGTAQQLALSRKRELDETIGLMRSMSAALATVVTNGDSETAPASAAESSIVTAFLRVLDSIDGGSGKGTERETGSHSQKPGWAGSTAPQALTRATSRARQ